MKFKYILTTFAAAGALMLTSCEGMLDIPQHSVSPVEGYYDTDAGAEEGITAVYGILALDGAIYYGVHIEKTLMGTQISADGYIPAELASGSFAELTPSTIPENAFEQHKAEVDEELAQQQKPSGEGDSGSAETPDPEGTENNLERIILSVVIAVLCVAVVLLIFRPGHKKA